MKHLIKLYLQYLIEERKRLSEYLVSLSEEENTTVYSGIKLGLSWCNVKIAFWSSFVEQLQEKS